MPYKVVHVATSSIPGTINYTELNELLDDGWEIEDTKDVTFRGVETERYRLRKGAEERGLTARESRDLGPESRGPNDVMGQGGAPVPGVGNEAMSAFAQLLAGQASHLGSSVGHQIPGAQVVSGNSHQLIFGAGVDAFARGLGPESCPYSHGSAEAGSWMAGYRQAASGHD